ncbi:GNAT family N-acetyltransferase [Paenibacillus luteus]|uniref:GNAT family N-acetyltransferase n=1 Tax=Paenibacillus luteus TaxID=2545753 RepID=UPI001143AE59|nr:GNAT family N-acetyltransferase [Paenibacillus luteus]
MKVVIDMATVQDAYEILALQKRAYRSEAELYNDFSIEPLIQTVEELKRQFNNHTVLKASKGKSIIGSVRCYNENESSFIGKLMVHPEYQGLGVGKLLMQEIEKACFAQRYELFTGSNSLKNIRLYEKLGYRIFNTKVINEQVSLVFMEKTNA